MSDPRTFLPARPRSHAYTIGVAFLAGYDNPLTREVYGITLRQWFEFALDHQHTEPLEARRVHIELWARSLDQSGLAKSTVNHKLDTLGSFYRYALEEEIIVRSPMLGVKRHRLSDRSTTAVLDRFELAQIVREAEKDGARSMALVCLLGFNGLRVSEALGIDITDISKERYHHIVLVHRKGGDDQLLSVAPVTHHWLLTLIADRTTGPVFLGADDNRMNRNAARRVTKRLAVRAGITKRIHPHVFRHTFVTLALDGGANPRDVQTATNHRDPRMFSRYDHRRDAIEKNPTFGVAAMVMAVA